MGFPFLFVLCTAATIIISFVDIEKGRESCRIYIEERKPPLRVATGPEPPANESTPCTNDQETFFASSNSGIEHLAAGQGHVN
jgi:hypothetical protein